MAFPTLKSGYPFLISQVSDFSCNCVFLNGSRLTVRENGQRDFTHREWVAMFERVLNEFKDEMKAQNRSDEFFGARIIYSTLRAMSAEELDWYLEDCIRLKQEFPHLIAGS